MRGRRNTTQKEKKKQPPKIPLEYIVRPKFLECICLEKNTKVLSSRHSVHVKENERNGQDYQKYALFVPFLRLFFSLLLSLSFVPMLRFLRVRILSLSPFKMRLCARLCARVCVSRAA
jgi:hypothetical protein